MHVNNNMNNFPNIQLGKIGNNITDIVGEVRRRINDNDVDLDVKRK